MKMKNLFCWGAIFLTGILAATGGASSAEAKVVTTSNVSEIVQYDSGGANYSGLTLINEYGQIIYNSDSIDQKYQQLIEASADSWNLALNRNVFVNYKDIGVATDVGNVYLDKVDLEIVTGNVNVLDGHGYSSNGYGDHKGTLTFSTEYLTDDYLVKGSEAYASAVSAIRHEMGHALGLGHDYGVVMFTNSDPESKEAHDACVADLEQGIVPAIPEFNILAIQNILNNLSAIYYNYGYGIIPSKVIASARLDDSNNSIIGATFFKKTVEFNKNSGHPIQVTNLETNTSIDISNLIDGDTVESTIQVTTLNGNRYYLFTNNSRTEYYAVLETDVIPGIEIDFKGNYLNSEATVSATAVIDKNYNVYTINANTLDKASLESTTSKMELIGKTVNILSVYTSTKGNNYYNIDVDGKQYVINSAAFFLTGDAEDSHVVQVDFDGNFLTNKKAISTKATINRNYNIYTIDDRIIDATYKSAAILAGTTESKNLVNRLVGIVAMYTSTKGNNYYRINIDGAEYIINAAAFD